jgi:hypothetical protein
LIGNTASPYTTTGSGNTCIGYNSGYFPGCDGANESNTLIGSSSRIATANLVENGTALGKGSIVNHSGSTAIGYNAMTTKTDQIMLGSSLNTVSCANLECSNITVGGVLQNTGFSDTLKDKLDSLSVYSSTNRLDPLLIGNGNVSVDDFDYLHNYVSKVNSLIDDKIALIPITGTPEILNYSAATQEFTSSSLGTSGTWYNVNKIWKPIGFLAVGTYTIILNVQCTNLSELLRVRSKIHIMSAGSLHEVSAYGGKLLDSSTSNEPEYYYSVQHYINVFTPNLITIEVLTEVYIRAGTNCNIIGRLQLLRVPHPI